MNIGDYEKAEETLAKLPVDIGLDFDSNLALLYTLKQDYMVVNQFCQLRLYVDICYACSNLMYLSNAAAKTNDFQKSFELSQLELNLLDTFQINSERTVYACWQMAICANEMSKKELALQCLEEMVDRLNRLSSSPIQGNPLFSQMEAPTQVVSAEVLKSSTKDAIQILIDKEDFIKTDEYTAVLKQFASLA